MIFASSMCSTVEPKPDCIMTEKQCASILGHNPSYDSVRFSCCMYTAQRFRLRKYFPQNLVTQRANRCFDVFDYACFVSFFPVF